VDSHVDSEFRRSQTPAPLLHSAPVDNLVSFVWKPSKHDESQNATLSYLTPLIHCVFFLHFFCPTSKMQYWYLWIKRAHCSQAERLFVCCQKHQVQRSWKKRRAIRRMHTRRRINVSIDFRWVGEERLATNVFILDRSTPCPRWQWYATCQGLARCIYRRITPLGAESRSFISII